MRENSNVSRRTFLKSGMVAAAAGIVGVATAQTQTAAAAVSSLDYIPSGNKWSKLHPKMDYGGASVRFVENNAEWLGTSKLVGTIARSSEYDSGFTLALRGELGEKARWGFMSFTKREPLTDAFAYGIGPISPDDVCIGVPNEEKMPIPDPEQMSRHIKDLAYYLRADEVGIGNMPSFAYYGTKQVPPQGLFPAGIVPPDTPIHEVPNTEPDLPYVITFAVEQHLETFMASTGYDGISAAQSFRSYHAVATIAIIMARYIRTLGYNARAHHFGNYNLAIPPAMIASGMGELGRTGDCVVHPRMGFRNKVGAVTTDLPLTADKPIDFGLLDFCRVCQKCVENCPSEAITSDRDPVEKNGYLRWNSDFKKCAAFRAGNDEGVSCGRCIKVCPWNSKEDSWFHKAGIWVGSKGEAAASVLKGIDDMFGYGTEIIDKYRWWLEWPELYKIKMPGSDIPL